MLWSMDIGSSSGGCHYLKKGDSYPSHVGTSLYKCDVNDCQLPGPCIGGQCSHPLSSTVTTGSSTL
eukprot:scaffold231_cov258-Chaetoceros_neogracile.AAC.13